MSIPSFWYRALSIAERGIPAPNETTTSDRARRRLERWRAQSPFFNGPLFAERLRFDGLNEQQLLDALSETDEAIAARINEAPEWATGLDATASFNPLTVHEEANATLRLLAPFKGMLAAARTEMVRELSRLAQPAMPVFEPEQLEALLFAPLPWAILSLAGRTFALELNVARIEGLLDGETPEQRFESFVNRLQRPEAARDFFEEYPVLARDVHRAIRQWSENSIELPARLLRDWAEIRTVIFRGSDPGPLAAVTHGGDGHCGGRSVAILEFSSGRKLVYKPRSLAVDVHFQELLEWMNQRGLDPEFHTLRILECGEYGWSEYVESAPCQDRAAVERFYRRQGGYLALLYALDATDFHFENLKAGGEHPYLIDLEALFHPRLPGADDHANPGIDDSVLRIGLLPRPGADECDLSGLADVDGTMMPQDIPACEGAGTDEMRFVPKRFPFAGGHNRPTLTEGRIELGEYASAMEEGFDRTYRLLLEHRDELLAEDGPIHRFAGDRIRVIFRATRFYALLQQEMGHPNVLRDGLDRDRVLDHLWITVADAPYLKSVLRHERDDLSNGDIPIFSGLPSSRDVRGSSGRRIAGVLSETGLELVERRIRRMSAQDLSRQLWFVRASLASVSGRGESAPILTRRAEPAISASPDELVEAADAIGNRVQDLAYASAEDVTWLGLSMDDNKKWSLAAAGPELYDGLAGIALFLAYLGDVTNNGRHTALARATIETCLRRVVKDSGKRQSIGAFSGLGGILYTLTHLAALWKTPALLERAAPVVDRIAELIDGDEALDLIEGAAGCLLSLLRLHDAAPSPRLLALARRCGEHLVSRAGAPPAAAWTIHIHSSRPLTGLSHGAAGIAWALLELSARTGDARVFTTAARAIDYERSVYSEREHNWPDFRTPDEPAPDQTAGEPSYVCAWCHGAAGIGLARIQCLRLHDDYAFVQEIEKALATTEAKGICDNHSLCHGEMGNLELLIESGRLFGDAQRRERARLRAAGIARQARETGWVCGNPLRVEAPGLMTGISGMGYALLRAALPYRVPSVLTLEAPIATGACEQYPAAMAALGARA